LEKILQLNSVFLRTMAVEYEGTRQQLLEYLEQMTRGTAFEPVFTQLADEHNRRLADMVEVFYDFENTPKLPASFNGTEIYPKFLEAMKRLSMLIKPQNLEALLNTLQSISQVFEFALVLEQATVKLYGGMAKAAEDGVIGAKLNELTGLSTQAARSLETRMSEAPDETVEIEISPIVIDNGEDEGTSVDGIMV
jgi:hypothetical protein